MGGYKNKLFWEFLAKEGADISITDIHKESLKRVSSKYGAKVVGLDEIYD